MKKHLPGICICIISLFYSYSLAGHFSRTTADSCEVAAPTLWAEQDTSCAGRPIVLWASGCAGTVTWSNGLKGDTIVSRPAMTRTYTAYCQKGECKSVDSKPLTIMIPQPEVPFLTTAIRTLCVGDSTVLYATGCPGTVIWSNGMTGQAISVRPTTTTSYTAICRTGSLDCISCFAEPLEVQVATAPAPLLVASKTSLCAGDSLSLQVIGCTGNVRWLDTSLTGPLRVVSPTATTTYQATCVISSCEFATPSMTIQVAPPSQPAIQTGSTWLCEGEAVSLRATGCEGTIRWSNGMSGAEIRFVPTQPLTITARCSQGSCQGEPSLPVTLMVIPKAPTPLVTDRTNECPYVTLDLMTALTTPPGTPGGQFEFRMASSRDAASVPHPGVAGSGKYYVFERTKEGCYSDPAVFRVTIKPCLTPVPVCSYFTPSVRIEVDTFSADVASYTLSAVLDGMASYGHWTSDGGGTFSATDSLSTVYLPGPSDRLRGWVGLSFTTNDPDGEGPCEGASAYMQLKVREQPLPLVAIGLSKEVLEPVKQSNNVYEITYLLKVQNMGSSRLTNVQVVDDLATAFIGTTLLEVPSLKADPGFKVNSRYNGATITNLLDSTASELDAGASRSIVLTLKVAVSNTQSATFINSASVSAINPDGIVVRDISTNGLEVDPDQDGNAGNDQEPTPITLHASSPQEEPFIPEGFSPNGDGINDQFTIHNVPAGLTLSLEIYNRWGQLVYKNDTYQNEWDGKAELGIVSGAAKKDVPDGNYFYVVRLSDGRKYVRFMTITR